MNLREYALVPTPLIHSGKFISNEALRLYGMIALFEEEWVPLWAIKVEWPLSKEALLVTLRELRRLGLVSVSSKRITGNPQQKFKLLPQSEWAFSKDHMAHLGNLNGQNQG